MRNGFEFLYLFDFKFCFIMVRFVGFLFRKIPFIYKRLWTKIKVATSNGPRSQKYNNIGRLTYIVKPQNVDIGCKILQIKSCLFSKIKITVKFLKKIITTSKRVCPNSNPMFNYVK